MAPARARAADASPITRLIIVALLDALALETAIVLGHSMGGAIAQWLALDHPERISAAILAGTGARLAVKSGADRGHRGRSAGDHQQYPRAGCGQNRRREDLKQQSEEIMLATDPLVIEGDFVACDKFDVSLRLAEIDLPTLILAGETDKMTPPALSQELAEGIHNSGAGDYPKCRPHDADGAAGAQRRTHRRLA